MTAETFELTPSSNAWPLLFKFRGPVLGTGFVALVEFTGRLLLRPHGGDVPDGFWIDGVNPGGFAFGACRLKDAHLELHSRLTGILADIAEEAESFDAFKSLVEEFFWQTDDQTVGEWDSCVREAQSGRLAPIPGILPVMPATEPLGVRITLKPAEDLTPKDNSAPGPLLASVAQMSGGPIPLKTVWAMLDVCAPGHTRKLRTHNYSIGWNGVTYRGFPKGEHGDHNPEIERSHVRRMVKFFSIQECAARYCGI